MSQEEIKIDICQHALKVLESNQNHLTLQISESIEAQLLWLISYFKGECSDRQKLYDLTFGHYAAREIDPRDTELISALNRAFYVADRTRMGLKLDLKILGKVS